MGTEVTIRIKSDNAALVGADARAEVVRILRETADRISNGQEFGRLNDINGNKAGDFDAHIDEREEG